jgi:hypothetical protein
MSHSLKHPQMICTGEDVRHPPYKPSFQRRWGGGWSLRGGSIDPATLWRHVSVGPVLAVYSNPGARSDRTRLPSHQQYCDLPRYSTLQVQSQPWSGHWLIPQIANKSCRKRKMQSLLLVIFQSFNFSYNTPLNNWLENLGDFVSPIKKHLWCKCSNVIENAIFTEYSAETKHETWISMT